MLKDFRSRVNGTYDLLRFTLKEVNSDPENLLSAVREADEQTIAKAGYYDPAQKYPLRSRTDRPVKAVPA